MRETSKMLHGGRLGNVRDDVAKFASSIKDDARLADAVVAINKAHVAMLIEQKIIPQQDGAKLLIALTKNEKIQLDPSKEDVHMAVEEVVLAETGPEVGGNLHIAKSRNDQVATAIRMELRNELLCLMDLTLNMQQAMIETANKHVSTVILEYTHLQPAQPVTFGHYLLLHINGLTRDLQRLQAAYQHVNLCPLGAGALATTSFPINRQTTANLLGFDEVLDNSLDAVGSRDFIVETVSALALMAVNLSRLAEDFIVWSSPEFGVVELPDEFTSTSSIMPQKKNPEVLEIIRARASYALGDYVVCAGILKSLPTTYNLDLQEVTPKLWATIDNLSKSLTILTQLIPNIKVTQIKEDDPAAGFVGATELANMLVRKYNVPFRTAHKIVGALVKVLIEQGKTLSGAMPDLLAKCALEASNLKLNVKNADIVECANPIKLIETYKVQGGPSTAEVKKSLVLSQKRIDTSKASIDKLKKGIAQSQKLLQDTVTSYSGLGSSKT
ncbi:MAG: argininosuccinate lyase [Candidatus Bathyarchaeota archaeon]|nr:argininosuccinate lyase [Candidatus Bathyarchaeota archaeon]